MVSIPILANNSTLSFDFNASQNTLMELPPQEYDLKIKKILWLGFRRFKLQLLQWYFSLVWTPIFTVVNLFTQFKEYNTKDFAVWGCFYLGRRRITPKATGIDQLCTAKSAVPPIAGLTLFLWCHLANDFSITGRLTSINKPVMKS